MLIFLLISIFSLQKEILSYSIKSRLIRNLDELSEDIVILHINDVHSGINNTIGYDGFELYYDELKSTYKNIIKVDVGDHIQGGIIGSISEGDAIIQIMNKVGFDVATIGNHEFDYGIEQLLKLEKNITSRYICANFCYRKNKTSIFNPYKIINIGDKKIAFIGVLTPITYSKTYLSTIKDENGEPLYYFLTDNNGQELYDTIQNYINKLRTEEKVDYIIILAHVGMIKNGYKTEFNTEDLIFNLEGVDAILDGHTHAIYNTTSKDKKGKDIQINQVGTSLQAIGTLIIKENGNINSQIISEVPEPNNKVNATKIKRDKERWVNTEMNNFINNLWTDFDDELNIQFGYSDFDFIIKPEEDSIPICRYQECTLGNLITDAVKTLGNGELTIINGGSIRNNMYKGNLTRGGIINALPWFNNIVLKRVTGQCILDALEYGVSKMPNGGGLLQISGITFDADVSFESSVLTDASGMFVNVTGKRRVSNVKINGKDLEVDKLYNASLLEYNANGGGGYSMFVPFNVFNESLVTDTDALCFFIKKNLNGNIPEEYRDTQGRININYNSTSNSTSNSSSNPSSNSSNYLQMLAIISLLILSIIFIVVGLI